MRSPSHLPFTGNCLTATPPSVYLTTTLFPDEPSAAAEFW